MTMNGERWWRKPSFSIEDIIRYLMLMLPIAIFLVGVWVDIRDIKRDISTIKAKLPTLATRPWIRSMVSQGNDSFDYLDERVDYLEGGKHTLWHPIHTYDEDAEK